MIEVQLARIFLKESDHCLNDILDILHNEICVRHVVVLRGIEGFEEGGKIQSTQIFSLSLNLPLIVEFFDVPGIVAQACSKIQEILPKGHIILLNGQQLK